MITLRSSLSHLDACPPWSDDLPKSLADIGRRLCLPASMQTRTEYGTTRFLQSRRDAVKDVVARIPFPANGSLVTFPVESLPNEIQDLFTPLLLRFATKDAISKSDILRILESAIGRFWNAYPGIAASLRSLVWSVHILEAESDDYDVSHSSPAIPFSIFISVPQVWRPDACRRVFEAIVHETMHLQLSLIERVVPLLRPDDTDRLTYSPWKREYRQAGGILHALYVFRVIERFWSTIAPHADDSGVTGFAETRIAEITEQIEQIREFGSHPALTNEGRKLVLALLK